MPLAETDGGVDFQFDSQGSYLEVRNPRMYDLVRNNVFSSHLLALVAQAPGFVPHSSTYGNDCQRDFDQM